MEIEDSKLYREFIIKNGKYAGSYKIYWNRHIFRLFDQDSYLFNWLNDNIDDVNIKDGYYNDKEVYIESMDGIVMRLLEKIRKVDKKGRIFYFCKFPTTYVYYYYRVDGKKVHRNFYGNFMYTGNSTLRQYGEKITNKQKALFVTLVLNKVDIYEAYKIATGKRSYNFATLNKRIMDMLNDKIVKKELSIQLQEFNNKLNEYFTDEMILKELKSLIENSRKGTLAHRENIKLILELTNRYPTAQRKANITDIEYEEVIPELPPKE